MVASPVLSLTPVKRAGTLDPGREPGMSTQVTVPIELSEEEAAGLQAWARRHGVSVSELVRRLVRQAGLAAEVPLTDEEYANDPLWSIAGMVETGTVDGSVSHDQNLCGADAPAR